ncbi:MAG TPA: type II toxin-antitoxin system VapC family toxin [Thermoanaerobaculia bacterium]|nr:type II toxin-antitoxin system VapC family toxin [Thermoanaerobaculia bacterium]
MGRVVLDASAILVLINDEPGAAAVAEALEDAVVSAVNLSEVVAKLLDAGMPRDEAEDTLGGLGLEVLPFNEAAAWSAAALRTGTKKAGLSLGDRACLALARELGLPALTSDTAWAKTPAGVEVRLVR